VLALILVPALAGCGSHARLASASATALPANGPAADYPVVIGDPYKIGAKLYTPADTMNYDAVGFAATGSGEGVTGSHHTLPLPSYVEVTSLDSGKTILVRLERRGPMDGDALIALSPMAMSQLGVAAGAPVRVRRVNPPEQDRAALRAGRSASARMDTPASLVAVLKRKLPGEGAAPLTPPPPASPKAIATVAVPPSVAAHPPQVERTAATPSTPPPAKADSAPPSLPPLAAHTPATVAKSPEPRHAAAPAAPQHSATAEAHGRYGVQAATMSTLERAKKVAGAIDGSVSKAGRYYRVHTGPFATRKQAEASLAKVRAAGYSDARIYTNDG
jgi:rare lipoprotein A